MQYITEHTQVPVLLDPGMAGHEAFKEFARHQVSLGGLYSCFQDYFLKQDVI